MSVGQHLADVAEELVVRGHRVLVLTANRGYDDPTLVYPFHETRNGVDVWRLPLSSLGKAGFSRRVLAAAIYLAQSFVAATGLPRLGGILASTVPPLAAVAGLAAQRLRGVPLAYWVMDLNPDQLIALGRLSPRSASARLLAEVNQTLLRRSSLVIALDRFMAQRLRARGAAPDKLVVIPPWPHENHLWPVAHAENPFRSRHGLADKLVLMYSGNHSPSNPLGTFLALARALDADPRVVLAFVGGGQAKAEVERFGRRLRPGSLLSLPYQPLSEIRYSLSAADCHLVSLGEPMVGIIHPCKVYGAMAVARPVLYCGPAPSHVSELLAAHDFGWSVGHGDVDAALAAVEQLRSMSVSERRTMGDRGRAALVGRLDQAVLRGRVCDHLEAAFL